MSDENQQPSPQPDQTENSPSSGQIIQPTSSGVSSSNPQTQATPIVQTSTPAAFVSSSPATSPAGPIAPPSPTQPMGMVDGQPFIQQTPMSSSQLAQLSAQRPSKWRYFFIVLGILQAVGIAVFFLIMAWAGRQADAGVSGIEFIGLIVYVLLVPVVGLIAFINLVGLPLYMRRHKPHGKGLAFSIVSLSVSAMLVLYGAYVVYQFRVAIPKQINQLSQQSDQEIKARQQQQEQQQQQFAADNAKPEITKGEAIALLNSCQLRGFYYTNQTSPKEDGNWGELSSTGVVLTKIDGKPYRISIASTLESELVPIARQAQKTCAGQPQFWHDGHYE